jgi:hypothetical protein
LGLSNKHGKKVKSRRLAWVSKLKPCLLSTSEAPTVLTLCISQTSLYLRMGKEEDSEEKAKQH